MNEVYNIVRDVPVDHHEILVQKDDIFAAFLTAKLIALQEFREQVRIAQDPKSIHIFGTEFGYDIMSGTQVLVSIKIETQEV